MLKRMRPRPKISMTVMSKDRGTGAITVFKGSTVPMKHCTKDTERVTAAFSVKSIADLFMAHAAHKHLDPEAWRLIDFAGDGVPIR